MPGQAKRAPKGSVSLESFQGQLRLRLPRQLFGGKQKYLSLGLTDTPTHRKFALAKAQLIESDIVFERFDPTLAKYSQPPAHPASAASATAPTVLLLWQRYAADRKPGLKPKTGEKYDSLERLFAKIAPLRVDEPLAVKQARLEVATLSRTKNALAYLAAACEWGPKAPPGAV